MATGIELFIDNELIDSYKGHLDNGELEKYSQVAGVGFEIEANDYESNVTYSGYSLDNIRLKDSETGLYCKVPREACRFKLKDRNSRKKFAAYTIWSKYLTVGSIIKEWGVRDFHAMVVGISGTNFHWVGINSRTYKEKGQIEFLGKASTSSLGKIERARLGQLSWNAINLTEGEKE